MGSEQRVSRVLLALLAGLGVGIAVSASHNQLAHDALRAIAPIGSIWINTIRMTVVPLVVSLLFTSIVTSEHGRTIGRNTFVAFATFVAIPLFAALLARLIAPPLMADMKVTNAMSAAL